MNIRIFALWQIPWSST